MGLVSLQAESQGTNIGRMVLYQGFARWLVVVRKRVRLLWNGDAVTYNYNAAKNLPVRQKRAWSNTVKSLS